MNAKDRPSDQNTWTVTFRGSVRKALLPESVCHSLIALIKEIEIVGPVRSNWHNFGKLSDNKYHCHLKKGRPTYVAVWEVRDKKIRIVEVIYAGTHEKAPY